MNNIATWRDYVQLTKPRIIQSNLIAAFGGFWMASGWRIDLSVMLLMLAGSSIVMASACVFNNYLDRDMDQKMERTQNRALPTGRIEPRHVLIYGAILGIIGTILLGAINWLTAVLGLVGIFVYVIIYTLWLKRTSTWSTSIGGISGAMPPVIGYVSVTEQLDAGAWLLFAILFLWQPPHFWALGIRRKEEYRAAGFPLLPVVKGVRRTKWQMIPYVVLLIPTSILLYVWNYVGVIYLVVAVVMGVYWLWLCISGLWAKDDEAWSKRTFVFSLYYLMITFAVIILNTVKI
ncbi:protoheme IX farnesyltransferase [Xylanibacillus composti]|uniref:Protoheme IX farnesyltransferase n=1 Tax=Xylanibacillus composti TaxID=1572762 RepID=A0A8J4M1U6_9BACL|nr:heme o synthase [Xylanibacillus composti]MDT9723529.1 protoheme IX farnesyltransferase [Xylanibacillus composti]GIQ68435.1 protoheme IX farnesyltransferase 1 [Xylanibacillus composti]